MKRNGGITLIALVVTVIVLMILAGVSITMLTGENGLINQARQAKHESTVENIREALEVVKGSSYIDERGKTSIEKYFECLDREKIEPYEVTDKGQFSENTGFLEVDKKYSYLVEFNNFGELEVEYEGEAGKVDRDGGITEATIEGENIQAELPVKLTVTVENTKGSINNLKWSLTKESEEIGTDGSKYENEENSNIVNLEIKELETYYLHVLTSDRYGRKTEIIKGPIVVENNYHKHSGNPSQVGGCYASRTEMYVPDDPWNNCHDYNGNGGCPHCGATGLHSGDSHHCYGTPHQQTRTVIYVGCGKNESTLEGYKISY